MQDVLLTTTAHIACKCPFRVRSTPESVVGDAEVQHQRHRTRRVREVTSQLDVPTSLTPAPSHLLCFYFVGCVKEVSKLINHSVVSLFDTRVSGTGANMITENINRTYTHKLFEPQVERGSSDRTGIVVPTQAAKKGCHRPPGHVSSL